MLVVDPIGDCDDAVRRIVRVGPQILPPDEFAHGNKSGDLFAPEPFFDPRVSLKKGMCAMKRFNNRDAGRDRAGDQPVRRPVRADDVRSIRF